MHKPCIQYLDSLYLYTKMAGNHFGLLAALRIRFNTLTFYSQACVASLKDIFTIIIQRLICSNRLIRLTIVSHSIQKQLTG